MRRLLARSVIGAVFAAALLAAGSIHARQPAAEIHVMTSGAFTAAHLALAADVRERRDAVRVVTDATSMGTGDTSIEARLARGEAADVVIVDARRATGLRRQGPGRHRIAGRPGALVDRHGGAAGRGPA